jgi:arsenate reductase
VKKILFLCTGNSCRSQMAEGWGHYYHGSSHAFFSAGIEQHGMNAYAIKAMAEADVDISGHTSKKLDELDDLNFDLVITVCDNAQESCPVFPGNARVVHHSFDDPPKLARDANSDEEKMVHYRRVRDEIRDFVKDELLNIVSGE